VSVCLSIAEQWCRLALQLYYITSGYYTGYHCIVQGVNNYQELISEPSYLKQCYAQQCSVIEIMLDVQYVQCIYDNMQCLNLITADAFAYLVFQNSVIDRTLKMKQKFKNVKRFICSYVV